MSEAATASFCTPLGLPGYRAVQRIELYLAMKFLILLSAALLALAYPAKACRTAPSLTLLDTLPAAARAEPVVAAVEAIELLPPPWVKGDGWGSTPLIRVRVVEAINGVQQGQVLVVDAIGTSCDQDFRRSETYFQTHLAKRRHYIAGELEANGYGDIVFHGAWKRDGAADDLVPVRRGK